LFHDGYRAHTLLAAECAPHVAAISRVLNDAGVIALVCGPGDSATQQRTQETVGVENFVTISSETPQIAEQLIRKFVDEQRLNSRSPV
jgi:hypothetical protein